MKAIKVIISEDVKEQLAYFDWDVEEVEKEECWPNVFPDAKVIEVTDCEMNYIEVNVDGTYYVLDCTGEIIEKGRM